MKRRHMVALEIHRLLRRSWTIFFVSVLGLVVWGPVSAQNSPDLSVCNGVDACNAPSSVCDDSGFTITLTSYTPAGTSGVATYVYTVCAPANDGTCSDDSTKSCQDNSDCWTNRCQNGGQHADTCSQDDTTPCSSDKDCNPATCTGGLSACRTDRFQDLSHTDVMFPDLGASCLSATTQVTVSCNSPARGSYQGTVGDGSCFSSASPVAKCDDPQLAPGECVTMTLSIAGELNKPGRGAAVVVDKESTTCESSCMQGPSCDPCVSPPPGDACLTRTIGFWGNHPWITNNYAPVTVCGNTLGCNGDADGESDPSCPAGTCDSIMEGLCSIGSEDTNQAYIAMVRQLTAAKLNLNATAVLFNGASCASWQYDGRTIQEWISYCESDPICGGTKGRISKSGCIEALDAFNQSEDGNLTVTPAPFDHPATDDYGNTSGADPSQCGHAQGNSGDPKLVIGKRVKGGVDCR
jgi:hypothetical protein